LHHGWRQYTPLKAVNYILKTLEKKAI
jgi:hypothetical protein